MNPCPKCQGKGWYFYYANNSKPCDACCPHDQGWWELTPHHTGYIAGADNACCKAGCGKLRRNLKRTYNIEVREAGVWETVDHADNMGDALLLASSLTQTVREEWIRISTPENEIL